MTSDLDDVFIWAQGIVPPRLTDSSLDVACWDPLDEFVRRRSPSPVSRLVARCIDTRDKNILFGSFRIA